GSDATRVLGPGAHWEEDNPAGHWDRDGRRGTAWVADLAPRIVAPAVGVSCARPAAAMAESYRDRRELDAAHDGHGLLGVACRPVAELARIVATPAVRGAVGCDGAGMPGTRTHRDEAQASRHGERRAATRLIAGRGDARFRGRTPEFPIRAPSPAIR